MRALADLRILDFTQMMMGPLCTQMLGDLGADVVKVEKPGAGDWMRGMPMYGRLVGGSSSAFHAFNRNKRSLALDLKNPDDRAALLSMVPRFDVVVENYRPGVMDRLGLGYDALRALRPDLIYVSGSGWGQDTAWAREKRPGQDLLAQAMSGVMMNTGRAGDPPTACGTPVADYAASQSMAFGILAAVIARDRFGVGQRVEVDLFSSLLAAMGQESAVVLNQDIDLERSHAGVSTCWNDAPYGVYPTSDGWVTIAMCDLSVLGRLLDEPTIGALDPFSDRDEAKRRIEAKTATLSSEALMARLVAADVWAAPVRRSREVLDELVATGSDRLVRFTHRAAGELRAVACPVRMSVTPADVRYPSPLVGEHTAEVLDEHRAAAHADAGLGVAAT